MSNQETRRTALVTGGPRTKTLRKTRSVGQGVTPKLGSKLGPLNSRFSPHHGDRVDSPTSRELAQIVFVWIDHTAADEQGFRGETDCGHHERGVGICVAFLHVPPVGEQAQFRMEKDKMVLRWKTCTTRIAATSWSP